MKESLTAPERETVITMSDDSDQVEIWTHQRRIHTKLINNPAFELLEDLSFGRTVGGRFVGHRSMISFRSKRTKVSPETTAKRTEALLKARAAKQPVPEHQNEPGRP